MKKTSIALMIGLFAIGCEPAAPPKSTAPPATQHNPEMMKKMMQHNAPPGAGEKKDEEKKVDGEAAPAAPATDAPAGEAPK